MTRNAPDWLTARPIAHRGLHDREAGRPENTLAAAEAAVAHRFAIECDVQLSGDGEAMVFHDDALGRLTERGEPVRAVPAAELAALRVGGTAERIPSLADFLARIAGRVPLVVEVKSRFDGDLRLAERTAAAVRDYAGPLALKSFDPAIVQALASLAPDRPRGIVAQADYDGPEYATVPVEVRRALGELLHLGESRPDFLSFRVADLPCAQAYLCRHLAGMPVMTWTVRDPEARAKAEAHADQMVFEGFLP
jgi:glycerophosphoryl diester phosphodiesterase